MNRSFCTPTARICNPARASSPHILHVAASTSVGGIERCSVALACLLSDDGLRVTFACSPGGFIESQCRAAGIPTVPFRPRNSGDMAEARRLGRWMREEDVALAHVHYRRDYLPVALSTLWAAPHGARRPRLVLHAHLVGPLGRPPRLSGWFYGRMAQAVVAVSETVTERLEGIFPLPGGFVRRIRNGVDVPLYAVPGSSDWAARRARVRQQWGIPPAAVVVGMVGRLHDKGQDQLLAAAPDLLSRFSDAWLVLVGPGDVTHYRALAQAAGVGCRTVISGISERIPDAMAGFDVLAHLPTDEAFGLVLAEAMAAGLPTVASAAGGCREVVQDGVTGFLVAPGDLAALHGRLARLLDPETGAMLRCEMGRAGRRRAGCEFSNEQWVADMLRLYGDLLTF